jgi:hypothetical protein
VARLVCADAEQLTTAEIDAIAAFLHAEQVRRVAEAITTVGASGPVVALGSGAFLVREAARGRELAELPWSAAERAAAPGGRSRRAGGRAVLTVVKVGGGLVREAGDEALLALCAAIGEAGARHRLLVVPAAARSPTRCARTTAASACATRRRTGWRSSPWTSSAGSCAT